MLLGHWWEKQMLYPPDQFTMCCCSGEWGREVQAAAPSRQAAAGAAAGERCKEQQRNCCGVTTAPLFSISSAWLGQRSQKWRSEVEARERWEWGGGVVLIQFVFLTFQVLFIFSLVSLRRGVSDWGVPGCWPGLTQHRCTVEVVKSWTGENAENYNQTPLLIYMYQGMSFFY